MTPALCTRISNLDSLARKDSTAGFTVARSARSRTRGWSFPLLNGCRALMELIAVAIFSLERVAMYTVALAA